MRTTFRRLVLLACLLRYGAKLLWSAAPRGQRLRWFAHLARRLHETPRSRQMLHTALPLLGPLVSAFAVHALSDPETAERSIHDALARLADIETALTRPLPPGEVAAALEQAMGHAPDAVFASIDPMAFESGIAEQVHAGRLRNTESAGRADGGFDRTAIKLLRVREVERLGDDIAVLGWAARLLERFSPRARELQLHALAQSFAAEVQRRFDLRTEAANLSQTGRHLEDDERVVVPEVVWALSNDDVLVIERIESVAITDLDSLRASGVDLEALAERIVQIVVEQAFAHGFFHAALDAQRLRVSVEARSLGRLVFGEGKIMATLTESEREFFVHGATALFEQEYGRLAAMHREAGHVAPGTRDEMLGAELRTRAEPHFAARGADRSPAALLGHLLGAVEAFDGGVSPALGLAHQALARAESLARALAPGLDTWQVVKGALKGLAREDIGHRGWIKRLARELPHLSAMPRLPNLFVHRLQAHFSEHERPDTALWAAQLSREQRLTRRLLWACVMTGALLGAGVVWLVR
ncbi:ABC transporter [Trinickia dabaoshanensis]|uniref:ABC transporter n=1 Tax=Trinickia dabaoshanensis TaxID=564714 RepID=A0A2N7VXZ6_9BURK|nr:AarF/UbiB family protein [Trinickia dabaoshanensis]PMS22011.1 ABC transporter [Trinickia dabaoshanensis]